MHTWRECKSLVWRNKDKVCMLQYFSILKYRWSLLNDGTRKPVITIFYDKTGSRNFFFQQSICFAKAFTSSFFKKSAIAGMFWAGMATFMLTQIVIQWNDKKSLCWIKVRVIFFFSRRWKNKKYFFLQIPPLFLRQIHKNNRLLNPSLSAVPRLLTAVEDINICITSYFTFQSIDTL